MIVNEISLVIQHMLHSLCSCTSFTSLRTNINTVHARISFTYNRVNLLRSLCSLRLVSVLLLVLKGAL